MTSRDPRGRAFSLCSSVQRRPRLHNNSSYDNAPLVPNTYHRDEPNASREEWRAAEGKGVGFRAQDACEKSLPFPAENVSLDTEIIHAILETNSELDTL